MTSIRVYYIGVVVIVAFLSTLAHSADRIIRFSGRDWVVRPSSGLQGPGPNNWSSDATSVWVDASGLLHLKLIKRNGIWYAAEVSTQAKLAFGRYQFQISGRIDQLDKNIVFGMFNYPDSTVGPDGTNEIDIEMAKWGIADGQPASYTVFPSTLAADSSSTYQFPLQLDGDYTTHSFTWKSSSISFSSNHGHQTNDSVLQFASWLFQPPNPIQKIPQSPMAVHINLWLFKGLVPVDTTVLEIVVHSFTYTSA